VDLPQILGSDGKPLETRARRVSMLAGYTPYDAADISDPHLTAWTPALGSPDTDLNAYRDRIVARVRDLVRNDGWASAGITRILDNAIGANFRPVAKPDYRELARLTGINGFDADWSMQAAVTALWRAGGGELVIPRGTYALDVAVPVIVPSGVSVRGEPGAWIVPDVSTVVDVATRPFPLANGAVFVTGNPDTGQRAAIENSTGVSEICFTGVQMRCDYTHGSLSAGQQLRGLGLFAVAGVRVSDCVVLNLPNTGIVAMDCSDATITGNRSNGNGYGPPQSVAGTKN
jgi:hypothetical protein